MIEIFTCGQRVRNLKEKTTALLGSRFFYFKLLSIENVQVTLSEPSGHETSPSNL
jgi:hypothetical protein